MQNISGALTERLAITCDRRNGIDRLFLAGELDSSSVLLLEAELNAVARPGGMLILDLRGLVSIDRWGLHALDRAVQRADQGRSGLFFVSEGSVLDALETAGTGHLLSGIDLSDLLESGEGAWAPISLPSPTRPTDGRPRVAEEAP